MPGHFCGVHTINTMLFIPMACPVIHDAAHAQSYKFWEFSFFVVAVGSCVRGTQRLDDDDDIDEVCINIKINMTFRLFGNNGFGVVYTR